MVNPNQVQTVGVEWPASDALPPVPEGAPARQGASSYAVPRRFLWMMDLLVQFIGFWAAWSLSPALHFLLAGSSGNRFPWLSALLTMTPATVGLPPPTVGQVLWIPLVALFVTLPMMHLLGGYASLQEQSRTRLVLSCALTPVAALSVVTLVLITLGSPAASRTFIYALAIAHGAGFFAYRAAIRTYKRRRLAAGIYAKNLLLIAPADARDRLTAHFERHVPRNLYRLAGYLRLPGDEAVRLGDLPEGRALEFLGDVDDLPHLFVRRPIHEVIAVHRNGGDEWVRAVVENCEYFRVTLRLIPAVLLEFPSGDIKTPDAGGLGLPAVVLRPRHLDTEALFIKRVFDIVVSAALLTLLSPLLLLIALAIKLTTPRLPILYPWKVVGYKGRTFTGYKFTTMVADADERQRDLAHLNEMKGPVFKIKRDPRVTPLGRWLRKFSLNELPQLWSVFKGDMSLVGPRPAYPQELERYELWQKRKLCVQPGITCLWQVRGRNRISNFEDWVRMDFEYIDNWSFWLDCRIIARTVWTVVAGSGW